MDETDVVYTMQCEKLFYKVLLPQAVSQKKINSY